MAENIWDKFDSAIDTEGLANDVIHNFLTKLNINWYLRNNHWIINSG
jgi:hypothetical protein